MPFTFRSLLSHLFGRAPSQLANNTVLLIRHSEKPAPNHGPGLSSLGHTRADAFATFFVPFTAGPLTPTALYAGADSSSSARPRLTLVPLARATGLPLNVAFPTRDSAALVRHLQSTPHGLYPLICWRHKQLPTLLRAFGADPEQLLPQGKWPIETFDWIILLTFNAAGQLTSQQRLQQQI